jgi:hypothetical protein
MRFQDEATERGRPVTAHGLSDKERVQALAAAHWHTYRHRLPEMISVSQLAMINADFAEYWAEICAAPITFLTGMVIRAQDHGHCIGDDPRLIAEALVSMFNQFCYLQLASGRMEIDDETGIDTLTTIAYRAIYGAVAD